MFIIDYRSRVPLYLQIVDNVEQLAARGILQPDTQLPPVRTLAVELSINPNTVARAYGELEKRGIIYSLPGRGNFIAVSQEVLRESARQQALQQLTAMANGAAELGTRREEWLSLCETAWQNAENLKGGSNNDPNNATA